MNRPRLLIAALIAASCAALVQAQTASPITSLALLGRTAPARSDAEFLKRSALANDGQVQAGRLAVGKSGNATLRAFAQEMVDFHDRAGQRLQSLAQKKAVALPSGASHLDESRLRLLKAFEGDEFDRFYAEHFGVLAHRSAIRLIRDELRSGQDPDIRRFAGELLPVLEDHLRRGEALQASLPFAAVNE
jgi:putative membrane protein